MKTEATEPASAKDKETTAVAKAAPISMAQQRKENEEYFQDPMAMVRAVRTLAAKSQWGSNLTCEEAQAFEGVAQSNGVSLTNGTAYVLGGNLYISLQGRLKLAHETNAFGGFAVDRAMTKAEREAYEIKENESAWIATVIRFVVFHNDIQSIQFTDFGRASTTEKNPVAKQNPVEMAMKRARARALKLAFPCGLNSTEEYMEVKFKPVEPKPETNEQRLKRIEMRERLANVPSKPIVSKKEQAKIAEDKSRVAREKDNHERALRGESPTPPPPIEKDLPEYDETEPHGVTDVLIDEAETRGNLKKDAEAEAYEAASDAEHTKAQEAKEKGGK